MGYFSTGMGDHLSSRQAMGISLCHQTFINSSTLLVSLVAVQFVHVDRKTFWLCWFLEHPAT